MGLQVILLLFAFVRLSINLHLPPNLHTCRRSDPAIDECLRSSVEDALVKLSNGDKQLGVVALEPLRIPMISVAQSPGTTVRVSQKLTNVEIYGLSSSKVLKFRFDFDKCLIYVETLSPLIRSRADYELKGQLLIFPLNSKGDSNITWTNLSIKHNVTCERYVKKETEYLRVTDYKLQMAGEGIHYDFGNLFKGNAELSQQVMRTINENALEIFEDVREVTEESHGIIFKDIANQLFNKVPFKEIFKD